MQRALLVARLLSMEALVQAHSFRSSPSVETVAASLYFISAEEFKAISEKSRSAFKEEPAN